MFRKAPSKPVMWWDAVGCCALFASKALLYSNGTNVKQVYDFQYSKENTSK